MRDHTLFLKRITRALYEEGGVWNEYAVSILLAHMDDRISVFTRGVSVLPAGEYFFLVSFAAQAAVRRGDFSSADVHELVERVPGEADMMRRAVRHHKAYLSLKDSERIITFADWACDEILPFT